MRVVNSAVTTRISRNLRPILNRSVKRDLRRGGEAAHAWDQTTKATNNAGFRMAHASFLYCAFSVARATQ